MSTNPQPVFARHETFHPRYGWLKKGFDAIKKDPNTFTKEDAHIDLGVGKNMARSIRYWCSAFKIIEEISSEQTLQTGYQPTSFGKYMLGKQGVDPYLEDLGSLWLLHWHLLKDPCLATAWQYTFNAYEQRDLTVDQLVTQIRTFIQADYPSLDVAESSLKKDATCILRMYGRLPVGDAVTEESIHCPFAELAIIRETSNRGLFAFQWGTKPGLTPWLITFSCFDFIASRESSANTVSLSKLSKEPGSPGKIFRLFENDLYSALEFCAETIPGFKLTEAAGLIQVSFSENPVAIAEAALHQHDTTRSQAIELFA